MTNIDTRLDVFKHDFSEMRDNIVYAEARPIYTHAVFTRPSIVTSKDDAKYDGLNSAT